MRVIATAEGYGGKGRHQTRKPGDVFEVEDGAKATWFKPVDEEEAAPRSRKGSKPGKAAEDEKTDESNSGDLA